MNEIKAKQNRRTFLKVSSLAGGGLLIGFNWSCKPDTAAVVIPSKAAATDWVDFNAYLKIGNTGQITIMSQNPEIGQNIKTSMPMIVAEELDVAWRDVIVEQAGLNTEYYARQVAGGSQSIRQGWEPLRKAGATAKRLLLEAAGKEWGVDIDTLRVEEGVVVNQNGDRLDYGVLAEKASKIEVPEDVVLKDPNEFSIIGKSTTNVDLQKIITGQPLFGIDTKVEGMKYATVIRPPAFGQELLEFDDNQAKDQKGVHDVFKFGNKIAIIANSTWEAIKAQKMIVAKWKDAERLEDTAYHDQELNKLLKTKSQTPRRKDGDVEKAFAESDEVIERIYEAPFLPHSCMEPMNFFANINEELAYLNGPIQTPAWTQKRIADLLEMPIEKVKIDMTRMGGGFGRRLYGDFALEAAEISKISKLPIQLIFTREDDMHAGTYRPASKYRFKVGLKDNQIHAYQLVEACINGQMFGTMPNNFPAGCIDNFLVESHTFESNITTGAWRAPYANFLAYAEQAFLDELAQILEKDAVALRLELFEKATANPIGKENNYEVDKYVGVIKLAVEKSGWGNAKEGVYQGFSAYFSHNTYVAEVADVVLENGVPRVKKITCAVDCGIVVNPIAALNQIEGGIIDGIGHAMYGDFEFKDGRTSKNNFNDYRLLRMDEAPKIEVHFVESKNDPTGLGEPTLPPAGGAIANAFAAATGKRFYSQPFIKHLDLLG